MSEIVLHSNTASKNTPVMDDITAALWSCHECQVWWGSQNEAGNGKAEEARYLLLLAQPNTTLFDWADFRGWHNRAADANQCLECGLRVATPRFTLWL